MINYQIFTDGSCRGNKNGGIGVVWLKNGKKVFEFSKGFKYTTNNRMELLAIYKALKSINSPIDSLEIVSDSKYALGCIFNENWNPKKNIGLISKIKRQLKLTQKLVKNKIQYTHVKGHNDNEYNELCDSLANKESSYE